MSNTHHVAHVWSSKEKVVIKIGCSYSNEKCYLKFERYMMAVLIFEIVNGLKFPIEFLHVLIIKTRFYFMYSNRLQ